MQHDEFFKRARSRGCPIVGYSTYDAQTYVQYFQTYATEANVYAWVWDCAHGLRALTASAHEYGSETVHTPDQLLFFASQVPSNSIIIAFWQPEFWQDPVVRQALSNIRDPYKGTGRTLVLLQHALSIPDALVHDVLLVEESLPAKADIERIIDEILEAADLHVDLADKDNAADALLGMTHFAAEQYFSLALRKEGINLSELWQAKKKYINNIPGLCTIETLESAADYQGNAALIRFFCTLKNAVHPPRLVVWCDEAEDAFAGVEGDLSGVAQDYLGKLATHIQETRARCITLYGQPGTGKSMAAKIACQLLDCLGIAFDLGAMRGSLQGESERNLRHALQVERSIVGNSLGQTLWIFTCNDVAKIPSKLRARMLVEFFHDLPTKEEREEIFSWYKKKYNIHDGNFVCPSQWTGREIERVCRIASEFRIALSDASKMIIPIAISQQEELAKRRRIAHGKFLSPHTGEIYYDHTVKGGSASESLPERKLTL